MYDASNRFSFFFVQCRCRVTKSKHMAQHLVTVFLWIPLTRNTRKHTFFSFLWILPIRCRSSVVVQYSFLSFEMHNSTYFMDATCACVCLCVSTETNRKMLQKLNEIVRDRISLKMNFNEKRTKRAINKMIFVHASVHKSEKKETSAHWTWTHNFLSSPILSARPIPWHTKRTAHTKNERTKRKSKNEKKITFGWHRTAVRTHSQRATRHRHTLEWNYCSWIMCKS